MDLHGIDDRESGENAGGGSGGIDESGGNSTHRRRRSTDDKLIFLEQNLVLGPPRLRQIRVKENSCDVHDLFGRYSQSVMQIMRLTLNELGADSIWGEITTYRSGGFVRKLTYNYNENNQILSELKTSKWLDRASRLIIVEFTLYNANTNVVNNVKFIGELPSTGGVITRYSIQSVKLGSIFWRDGIPLFVTVKNIGITNYVRILWNFVDFLIILLAYFTLAYNIWHPIYVNELYKRFEKDPHEYLQLDTLCFWNLVYRVIFAICAFLCFRDLLGFSVMFGIVFLAYAQLGLLLFGNVHQDFRNFKESLLTMIRMILGDFDYDGIEAANRVLGPIYFLTYILLVFFILLNMFLAIINDTYSSVKGNIRGGRNHLMIYLRKLLHKYCPKCCRPAAANDEERGRSTRDRSMSRDASPGSKRSVDKDNVSDFFEPVGQKASRSGNSDTAAIRRLTARVSALEDVIEQLVTDVDRTMRKVLPSRRKRGNTSQGSPSEGRNR
ncbi:unnamed protein product [Ceratitis capitata]|uniref:(Mediterranean fruit fly) hypothetical protein n=1 Tax=Ceratitis capitata TaxID=7213 RepID=A0A811U9P2_CERCA|nr:unnamed protein product [Ceratitis capitata]